MSESTPKTRLLKGTPRKVNPRPTAPKPAMPRISVPKPAASKPAMPKIPVPKAAIPKPAAPKLPGVAKPKVPAAANAAAALKKAQQAKKFAEAQAAAKAAVEGHVAAAPPTIKHVWTKDDTYADLAFKYYGSIKAPYWRLIYNHNKAIIGDHPNDIRVGLEIEIPPLPPELKK